MFSTITTTARRYWAAERVRVKTVREDYRNVSVLLTRYIPTLSSASRIDEAEDDVLLSTTTHKTAAKLARLLVNFCFFRHERALAL